MEMESKNGLKIRLKENHDLGRRELGFDSSDRTVSRCHVSFNLEENDGTMVVSFQVKGKNPIWVRDSSTHNITVYKCSQHGQLKIGDSFCVSSKDPVWFHLNRITSEHEDEDESNRYEEAFGGDISGVDHQEFETSDIPDIDPVKEFNFIVMGHEFDCYSKKLVSDIRNWNWFLEEPNEDSDEEGKKKSRNKRKKGGRRDDDDDDIWTGESEEDVELVKKLRNDPKPKKGAGVGAGASKSAKDDAKRKAASDEVEEDDDEDVEGDETLGGFIVDDEDIGEGDEEEDDEEEFEEDEDDE
ncbi:hypothetical protein M8C21_029514 [Ambrosia artemisiifolia]|uniref:Uncharacterized protein n=1 Tax=Ambrosia artemisiifolia TaxID=4212 RepID=A0AAD5GPS2_AMBAR|nr:hypothetical protein M8C21_029514 [Ambrosia artemisiifolia]